MTDLKQRIYSLAQQIADDQDLEIFDVELFGKGKLLLRVTVDKEGGVTLDDCERYSRRLGALLDIENPLSQSYTLEVTSPGLDRPLRDIHDFEKNKGKLIRIITSEKVENQNFFIGRIINLSGDTITVDANDREINIPFHSIKKARLEIELTCQKNSV